MGAGDGDAIALSDYELRHLAAHLTAAKRYADLHRLLAWETGTPPRNAWHEARTGSGDGTDGYLGDLRLAWNAATEGDDGDPASMALEVRYALMMSSVRGLAGAVAPELVAALVRTGEWSVDRAVAAAREVPSAEQRVDALTSVLALPGLDAVDEDRLRAEAVAAAEAVPDPYRRAGVVARLAIRLPPDFQGGLVRMSSTPPDVVEDLYATGGTAAPSPPEEHAEARLVRELAARLDADPSRVDDAMALTMTLTGELQRTLALSHLVPRLMMARRRDEAIAVVATLNSTDRAAEGRRRVGDMALPDSAFWGDGLLWHAGLLAEEVQRSSNPAATARRALEVSSRLGDADALGAVVTRIAGRLASIGSADAGVDLAGSLAGPQLAAALEAAAPHAGPGLSARIEELCSRIDDAPARAVIRLLLPADRTATGFRESLAGEIDRAQDDVEAVTLTAILAALGDQESHDERAAEAVRRVGALLDGDARAAATAVLVRWVPEVAPDIELPHGGLAPDVDATMREAMALALVALDREVQAIAMVQGVGDPVWRDAVSSGLAHRMASNGRHEAAFRLSRLLPEEYLSPELLEALGRYAGQTDVRSFLALVAVVVDPARRAHLLASAAGAAVPLARPPLLAATLDGLAAGGGEDELASAVLAAGLAGAPVKDLRSRLPMTRGVARARAMVGLAWLAEEEEPLAGLSELAPADQCEVALDLSERMDDEASRTLLRHAASLVPALPAAGSVRHRLLTAVGNGRSADAQTQARVFRSALLAASVEDRRGALGVVDGLLAAMECLGGATLLEAVGRDVLRVGRWWA